MSCYISSSQNPERYRRRSCYEPFQTDPFKCYIGTKTTILTPKRHHQNTHPFWPDWLSSQAKVDIKHSKNTFSVHPFQGKIMQGKDINYINLFPPGRQADFCRDQSHVYHRPRSTLDFPEILLVFNLFRGKIMQGKDKTSINFFPLGYSIMNLQLFSSQVERRGRLCVEMSTMW